MYIMTARGWQQLIYKTEPETVVVVLSDKEASRNPEARWSSAHQAFIKTVFAPLKLPLPMQRIRWLVQSETTEKRILERQPFE